MEKRIPVRCKGTKSVDLASLKHFQGKLKDLPKPQFEKLKAAIVKKGFRFPVFVWRNFILDGHQRLFVVQALIKEGWTIGKIPIVEIEAKDEREARELVLLVSSRYGKITDDGLHEFILEGKLDFEALKTAVDLPEIDVSKFRAKKRKPASEDLQTIVCPKCGHTWEIGTRISIRNQKQRTDEVMN